MRFNPAPQRCRNQGTKSMDQISKRAKSDTPSFFTHGALFLDFGMGGEQGELLNSWNYEFGA
jgi:hypothetical protein